MPHRNHHAHHGKPSHPNNATSRPHHHKSKHHHSKMGYYEHRHGNGEKLYTSKHAHHNKMMCHKKFINLKAHDQESNTALHLALKNNNYKTAFNLIKHGADVNATNNNGETALHIVSKQHHPHASKMSAILIKHGADVNIPQVANGKAKEAAQEISNDQKEIACAVETKQLLNEPDVVDQSDVVLTGENNNQDLSITE
jgi:ankyrin repeat protein